MNISTVAANHSLEDKLSETDEGHFLDFKSKRIKPSSAQEHFVSFANTDGGELYIGIEDKKTQGERFYGFSNAEEANAVIQLLFTQTEPSVEGVYAEFINFGKRGLVLHLIIPKSPRIHYTASKECYIRVNASTKRIKDDEILQLSYAKGAYSFEHSIQPQVEIDRLLTSEYLESYMERIDAKQGKISFLYKQGLLAKEDEKYTPRAASVLLFDDEPQAILNTRCAIKVYRLQTTEKEYKREYLQGQPTTIEGPLEKQIYKVIETVNSILKNVSYNVDGKIVKLRYPTDALHEILVNAVIHRDYSINDDIHVRIYDNRIEIQSPGKLPGYITIQNILKERYSRNPNIVRMLHKLPEPVNHDIGEGLDTAFNAMKKAGLVNPEIKELENAVVVTIEHRRIASLEQLAIEYLQEHDEISNKILRELSGEESENKVKKALQKLREQRIIDVIDPEASVFGYKYRRGEIFSKHAASE